MLKPDYAKYTPQEKKLLAGLVSLTFIGVLLITSVLATLDMGFELHEEAEELINRFDTVHTDSKKLSKTLASLTVIPCSSAHKEILFEHLNQNFFIQSIRYAAEDGTGCLVGQHAKHDNKAQIDELAGRRVAFNVRGSQQTVVGLETSSGRYTFTYPNYMPNSYLLFEAEYEVSYRSKQTNNHHYWMGNPKLNQHYQLGFSNWLPDYTIMVQSCGEQANFCATLAYTIEQLTNASIHWLILIFSSGVFAAALVGYRLNKLYMSRRSIPERVKSGIQSGNFFCHYQPIIKMQTGEIIGCEVLARFKDQYGQLSPLDFIPLVSQFEQSYPFTRHIINTAMADLSPLSLPESFKVNINIFPEDMTSNELWSFLIQSAKQYPQLSLVVEITEDQQLNISESSEFIKEAQANGIEVAIDDFGTGYSNLVSVQELNCDILKIDQSFIRGLQYNSILSSLIPNIVEMAKKLEMTIVAEGVETEAQQEILNSLGIEKGQGWLFGRPSSAQALSQKITTSNRNQQVLNG